MNQSGRTEKVDRLDKRLLHDVLEAYSQWRTECTCVRECYARWSGTRGADAALAFGACISALDREQRAAENLDRIVGRLGDAAPEVPLFHGLERIA